MRETLERLKAAGKRLAILSNGSPEMLESAVRNARLDGVFESIISVEEVGVYKPDPMVVWCNRYAQRHERLPGSPDYEITSLAELPALLDAEFS